MCPGWCSEQALRHLASTLAPTASFSLCLGRGVLEWLRAQAAPAAATVAAWAAALGPSPGTPATLAQALLLGPVRDEDAVALEQHQATLATLLGCPVQCMGYYTPQPASASGSPPPPPPPTTTTPAYSTDGPMQACEGVAHLAAPAVCSFLQRQGLLPHQGSQWWRAAGTVPDAWLSSSRAAAAPSLCPATLAAAPTLEPTPPPPSLPPPQRTIACLGGTFNPPTQAHLQLAAAVAQAVDEVWLVPCGPRQDKAGVTLSCTTRTMLTALALEAALPSTARVRCMPLEGGEATALASADLFARLEAAIPPAQATFCLAVGMDNMGSLAAWRFPQRLLANVGFLVSQRPGYEHVGGPGGIAPAAAAAGKAWPLSTRVLPLAECTQLSSSEVRKRVGAARAGGGGGGAAAQAARVACALDGLVHAPVAAVIANCGLY